MGFLDQLENWSETRNSLKFFVKLCEISCRHLRTFGSSWDFLQIYNWISLDIDWMSIEFRRILLDRIVDSAPKKESMEWKSSKPTKMKWEKNIYIGWIDCCRNMFLDLLLHSGSNVALILLRDLIHTDKLDELTAARLVGYAGVFVKQPTEKLLLEFQVIDWQKLLLLFHLLINSPGWCNWKLLIRPTFPGLTIRYPSIDRIVVIILQSFNSLIKLQISIILCASVSSGLF